MLNNAFGSVGVIGGGDGLSFGSEVASVHEIDDVAHVGNARWDSLVCVAELWRVDLSSIGESLAEGGRLFFVEPTATFGLANRVQILTGWGLERRYGLRFDLDIPKCLREAGLTPTSIDRFRIGGAVRTFVAGEARRY